MGEDVIIVDNYVDEQCIRHIHLMTCGAVPDPAVWGQLVMTREGDGSCHFRSDKPYHGPLDIQAAAGVKFRRLVVWSYDGCKNFNEPLIAARAEFIRLFGGAPRFAFVKVRPKSVKEWQEIHGMLVLDAEWMLDKCVAVGGQQP